MPRSWGYRTLRVAGRWRSAPLAFRPVSFARRVGSKLGQALPQHLWPTPNQHVSSYSPRPLAPYSVNSHVIPLRLLQTLNLHRWNCNVFAWSRKITVLNYVRNLSGSGFPRPQAPRPGLISMPGRAHRPLRSSRGVLHLWRWGFCTIRSILSACRRRVAGSNGAIPPVWWWCGRGSRWCRAQSADHLGEKRRQWAVVGEVVCVGSATTPGLARRSHIHP